MPHYCKSACDKLAQNYHRNRSPYAKGMKYCKLCEVYLFHSGYFCPCCGTALRCKPVNRENRERLQENDLQ